jgi:asparagine synthase (glutamine-hydrolysing)
VTAILAVLGDGSADAAVYADAMLARLTARGGERRAVRTVEQGWVAAAASEWEGARPGDPCSPFVAREGGITVVADATLYYRDALRARLARAGVAAAADGAAPLILAAYRAWGEDAPARLEGDFAFVLWDGERRRLLAARDFVAVGRCTTPTWAGSCCWAPAPRRWWRIRAARGR